MPSRLHPGQFYALPQAPQQFKQLLMVAGFDRYFQIAPCFRDEDARADRSPGEFYQLDVEMSFATQDDVFAAIEPVLHGVFEEFAQGKPVTPHPFPRIPFREAIAKYGTDKPDLRNPIVCRTCRTRSGAAALASSRTCLRTPKRRDLGHSRPGGGSPRLLRPHERLGQGRRPARPRLHLLARRRGGRRGPDRPQPRPRAREAIRTQLGLKVGDAAFFVAGEPSAFYKFAGPGPHRDRPANWTSWTKDQFDFCWIVDFPMYECNEEDKNVDFSHNPFSMPQGEIEALEANDPLDILAYQYDIVCNGVELCSGAVRNHRPDSCSRPSRSPAIRPSGWRRFRRHVGRVPLWRPAPRRHGPGHRPHRHAARRGRRTSAR